MLALTGLHALAAPRGDGLRLELLELLVQRQQLTAGNVEDMSAHLAEHFIQAGPNPARPVGDTPPAGVLPFARAEPVPDRAGTMPPVRRQR